MSFCIDYKVIFLQGKGPPSKLEIARGQLAEKKKVRPLSGAVIFVERF